MSPPLSDAQLRTLAAAMDRVLPGGDGPGAADANAIGYVHWLMREPEGGASLGQLPAGLAMLDTIARALWHRDFASCDPAQQDVAMQRLEGTPHPRVQQFLAQLVNTTLAGFLCAPEYGGNRDGVGWSYIGHAPSVAAGAGEAGRRAE